MSFQTTVLVILAFRFNCVISQDIENDIGPFTESSKPDKIRTRQLSSTCIPLNENCKLPFLNNDAQSIGCCYPNTCTPQVGFFTGISFRAVCLPPQNQNTNPPSSSSCPFKNTLEQIIEPIDSGEEYDRTLIYLQNQKSRLLKTSAYLGDPSTHYLLKLRSFNSYIRKIYGNTVENIGLNIFPLLVASETEPSTGLSGIGSTFTLYLEDGSSQSFTPTSKKYEIYKSLAHIPLALFSLLYPYANTVEGSIWRKELEDFRYKLLDLNNTAKSAFKSNANSVDSEEFELISETLKTIDGVLYENSVYNGDNYEVPNLEIELERYGERVFGIVENFIREAAELQMSAILPVLQKWKLELGKKWRDVYGVIPVIWPVSGINPRLQVLSQVMSAEQIRTQVFLLESTDNSILNLRKTVGKIVGDRTGAALLFGTKTKKGREFTFSLSGKQDLLSIDAAKALSS